jgi:hypothetical protein
VGAESPNLKPTLFRKNERSYEIVPVTSVTAKWPQKAYKLSESIGILRGYLIWIEISDTQGYQGTWSL